MKLKPFASSNHGIGAKTAEHLVSMIFPQLYNSDMVLTDRQAAELREVMFTVFERFGYPRYPQEGGPRTSQENEDLKPAYEWVESMVPKADDKGIYPKWHGWALRESFIAGISYGREHPSGPLCEQEEALLRRRNAD